MNIKLVFHDEKISWNGKWVFLGNSYKNLKLVEKKILGTRLKINNTLHEIFKEELKNYLQWTENQRNIYNDSIYWWMTSLAGRNNLTSNFFLYICQVKALKKILKKLKEKEFLIVCDDILLAETLTVNLKEYPIEKNNFIFFKKLKRSILYYFRLTRNFIGTFLDIILTFICVKLTSKEKKLPTGEIYLIHQHSDIDSLTKNIKLNSRYFPNLKEYLVKENLKLYTLTWYNFFWKRKFKAIKNIRTENCLIPEDWISFGDYITSIKNYFKTYFIFKDNMNYPNFDIKYLILMEKNKHLEQINSNLRFWTYFPALKKWTQRCEKLICIDHYENMIYEHALIGATRELKMETKIFGYHHTLSSYEFTAWNSLESEWNSKFKPDHVISLGSISNKFLQDGGVPASKIINGPALRYGNILENKKNKNFKNDKNILIPLSSIRDASYEMIDSVLSLCRSLRNTKYNFILKAHPNVPISKVWSDSEKKKIPENLSISDESTDKLLKDCLFTIFMSTAAAYNAVLNGNVVFNLRSELNFTDNYLDIFEKDYKFVNSYSLEDIKYLLVEFEKDKSKINEYQNEFEKMRQYLTSGFNKVNEVNLSKFKYQ